MQDSVRFWSQRFADHFDFILVALTDTFEKKSIPEKLVAAINLYKTQWLNISKKPSLLNCKWKIIQGTLNFKTIMRAIFSENSIPCWPDMMEHMIEEVIYFVKAIVRKEWNFGKELSWWANEHAENLEFVNCQLPILFGQDYGTVNLPSNVQRFLKDVKKENNNLSREFKVLSDKALEYENTLPSNLFQEFLILKQKHLRGIDKLIAAKLPLSKETLDNLDAMLCHERKEAIYAASRLESIAGKGRCYQGVHYLI